MQGADLATSIGMGAIADAIFGDPRSGHPVAGFGKVASRLEARVWRPRKDAGALYGLALVGSVTGLAALVTHILERRRFLNLMFATLSIWVTLGARSLGRVARDLAQSLERGDLEVARRIAPSLVGRDPSHLDAPELCRAAVESVAENTADAVLGPLLWAAVGGIPAAIAYRAANSLDAMVGHKNERYREFGWGSARLDDFLTWPAARLGALLAVLFAPMGGGTPLATWEIIRRDGQSHPSPNAGVMESAFAGALGVQLGGVNRYGDRVENRSHLGDGPLPSPADVNRAVLLSNAISVAGVGVAMALAWVVRR